MKCRVMSIVMGLALTGCGALRPNDYAPGADLSGSGVAIIGVHAEFSGVTIYDLYKAPKLQLRLVRKTGDRIDLTSEFGGMEYGSVEGKYVYIRLPATKENERYVISEYVVNGVLGSGASVTCRGQPAPTFAIKPGEVAYVGDVYVSPAKGTSFGYSWSFGFRRDAAAALAAVTEKHPGLAVSLADARLEYAEPEFGDSCTS